MTPVEQQEYEEFWAAMRPFAARIADYEAQATDGMTPRQADEVLEESFILALRNRKSFNPRRESVAEWMHRIFRKTRAYLRTVRPEVDAHKTRCTCFGTGFCSFGDCKRTADYTVRYGMFTGRVA